MRIASLPFFLVEEATPVRGRSRSLFARFRDDRSGAIAPIFAGLISFLVLVTATAVEIGRWAIARNELQASMDAAVLAGAAKLQLNQADKAAAVETAKKALKANRSRQRFGVDSHRNRVGFSVAGQLPLDAKGSADLQTPLSAKIGAAWTRCPCWEPAKQQVKAQSGRSATITNSKFELSLMLDITGSMCDSGTRPG